MCGSLDDQAWRGVRNVPVRPLGIELRTHAPRNADLYRATLGDLPGLTISEGPLLVACAHDAVIAPTNSFGYLDGGVDHAFAMRFGPRLQRALQSRIADEHEGEMPVGEAAIVATGDFLLPFLVAAPATRLPGSISVEPLLFSAMTAAFRAIARWNAADEGPMIENVVLPDIARMIPGWHPDRLVLQLREAIEAWNELRRGDGRAQAA